MIYLFDDTPEDYIKQRIDLEQYKDIIFKISILEQDTIDTLVSNFFDPYCNCVMIHRSFDHSGELGKKLFNSVRDLSNSELKTPVIVFSDGDGSVEYKNDHVIRALKKDKFYSNLALFLDWYKDKGKFDLTILVNGEKADAYKAVEYGQDVLSRIMFQKDDDCISTDDVDVDSFYNLIVQSHPAIGCSYSDILCQLDDTDMKVGTFRKKIKNILNSFCYYGKNIYPWK